MRTSATLLLRFSPATDAVSMAGAFAIVLDAQASDDRARLFLILLIIPASLGILHFAGVYESQRVETLAALVRKVLSALAIVCSLAAVPYLVLAGVAGLNAIARLMVTAAVLIVAQKLIVYSTLRFLRRRGHDLRWVCVVGAWERAREIAARFEKEAGWGLRVGCVGSGPPGHRTFVRYPTGEVLAADVTEVLSREVVDEVLIAVRPDDISAETATLQACEQFGLIGRILLDTSPRHAISRLERFGGAITLAVGSGRRDDEWRLTVKRVIDVTGAVLLIALLSPLLVVIAVLVELSSPGPIVFTQSRVGLHGRRFTVYKFRTMIAGAEALLPANSRSITRGPVFKDPADFRVTPIGRVLRQFSLDELPQLFNVIRGDMSLVGPRPLPVHESEAITGPYRRRFCMRPGITCLWQVNGRSNVDYATWMNYDLQYVDRWSLRMDTLLLLKTLPAVLSRRGAY